MSPLDEVIEKNQINPGHLYQHYEKASPLRKMPILVITSLGVTMKR